MEPSNYLFGGIGLKKKNSAIAALVCVILLAITAEASWCCLDVRDLGGVT